MKATQAASLLLWALSAGALATGGSERPVTKVITLLKDMVTQLQKEAEEDEDTYQKFGCWCETNDREKTKAISDAEGRITELQAAIEGYTATSSQLSFEISGLEKELANNQKALATATELRKKQLAEFNQEEKDMLQAVVSLKSAIQTLSKQNTGFLQLPDKAEAIELLVTVRNQMHKHADMLAQAITPRQRRLLDSFVQQAQEPGFDGSVATAKESYAPQSGEIFGVLKGMKETFETNLASSEKEEDENQAQFEAVKSSKGAEIAAGETKIETKTEELATSDEKNAESKQDLEDTQESLEADSKYLANLKEQCAAMDAEYQERSKTRNLEITAVSKALEVLSGDEAHDIFARSLGGASLLQTSAARSSSVTKAKVAHMFETVAQRHQDPRLSALATSVRLDAFTKVKEKIQVMVDKLVEEKADDVAHKDFCVASLNANQVEVDNKDKEKMELITKIDDLTMTMDELSKAIDTLKAEIATSQVELKKAGEERELANKEFQMTVSDQRATQKLLMAALNVLKGFYEKAALVQSHAHGAAKQGPPPPPTFKEYKNSAASGGVMGMMQGIIDDAKRLEDDATKAESEGQMAYESFVKTTNALIDEKSKDIVNKSMQKAKAEEEKVKTTVNRDEVMMNLEQLFEEAGDLHRSCDFLLKNFGLRAAARDEEIEALKQGIAMFSGASFSALVQQWDVRR